MATLKLTAENFEQTVSNSGIVFVDCWAAWCGGCKVFAPVYERVASQHPQHLFGKLDTNAESDLAASLDVKHVPTLMVYRDGILLFQQPGNFDEQALQDIVSEAVSIDMDVVRADQESA
jgi:thioredoxin 1